MRILILLVALLGSSPAHAQLDPHQTRLAHDLARVCMNEALGNEADCALIWAAITQHGTTAREQRRWLRAHSRCATGVLPQALADQRPGHCRWTRNLRRVQLAPPTGFRLSSWPRMRERWAATVALAEELVSGSRVSIVCAVPPTTWDGPAGRTRALARGFEPVDCKGAMNLGYTHRGRGASRHNPA